MTSKPFFIITLIICCCCALLSLQHHATVFASKPIPLTDLDAACTNFPSYWQQLPPSLVNNHLEGTVENGTLPNGYVHYATTVSRHRFSVYFYDYWKSGRGWFALGFSNQLSHSVPFNSVMDEQRSELGSVTLYGIFKDKRSRARDGQFRVPVTKYQLMNSSDWSTLTKVAFAPNEHVPEAFVDSDAVFGYTMVYFDFKDRDAVDKQYMMVAMNENLKSKIGKTPNLMNATMQYVQPLTMLTNCDILVWNIAKQLSTFKLYMFAPMLIVLAVLFMLSVINVIGLVLTVKSRRVRSRMPTYLISVVLLFLVHSSDIIVYIFSFSRNGFLVQIFWAISMALFALMFWNYAMMFARYLHVRNVYRLIALRKNQTAKQMGRMLRIHKKLSSRVTFIISSVLFAVAMTLLFGLIGYFLDPADLNRNYQGSITRFVVTCLMFIFMMLCIIVDFILNFSKIRSKGIRHYFFFDDPLYFRIELMSAILVPINSLILMILELAFYDEMNRVKGPSPLQKQLALGVARAVFFFLQFFAYYWTIGGIGTIVYDRYNVWKKRFLGKADSHQVLSEESTKSLIEEFLLTSDDHMKLFEDYCEKEFSSENIMLWKLLYPVKEAGFLSMEKALEIKSDYIDSGSMLEVNIDGKTRKELLTALKELSESKAETVSSDVFLKCYNGIMTNLSDTYSRLSSTDEFLALANAKAFELRLQGKFLEGKQKKPTTENSNEETNNGEQ